MELLFDLCALATKKEPDNYGQLFGNNLCCLKQFTVSATGATPVEDLIPDYDHEEGVVPIMVKFEDKPFDGYTHEMWIYGAPMNRRFSKFEPRPCKKEGELRAVGSAWLDIWCQHNYFPEHDDDKWFKVYVKARRLNEKGQK